MPTPLEAIQACIQALQNTMPARDDPNAVVGVETSFPRWKRHTIRDIEELVSPIEARSFEALREPAAYAMAPEWNSVLNLHVAYLAGLRDDIVKNPARYGAKLVARERAVARKAEKRAAREKRELAAADSTLSGKVSLSWLWHHLPLSAVAACVAALLVAFSIGVKVAHEPAIIRVLRPVLGITTDTNSILPTVPR